MIELTPAQIHAKDIVSWLVSNHWSHRCTGRTILLAICFIEQAMKTPGVWVAVWDHGPYHPNKELYMFDTIKKLIGEHYPDWNYKIHRMNKSFCMEKKQ
jgi:hypothetical protein